MMRSITAAFDDDVFQPSSVIAYGGSKNSISPLISSINDERITAVWSTVAFTAFYPIRANDPAAVAEVTAADIDFDAVNAAFFAKHLFGADRGLETPDIATTVNGAIIDVTVTFPDSGVPKDSRIFWMYNRGPDGSS